MISIFISRPNLCAWFDAQPAPTQQLWKDVLRHLYLTEAYADTLTTEVDHFSYYYHRYYVRFPWLNTLNAQEYYKRFVYLPRDMHMLFRDILARDDDQAMGMTEEQEPETSSVVNAERQTLALLKPAVSLFMQGLADQETGRGFKVATIKAIESMKVPVFEPAVTSKGIHAIYANYLAFIASTVNSTKEIDTSSAEQDVLREVFQVINSSKRGFFVTPMLMPHVKGIKSNERVQNGLPDLLHFMPHVVKHLATEWTTADNIVNALYQWMGEYVFSLAVFFPDYGNFSINLSSKIDDRDICPEQLVEHVGVPAVKAILYLYAAMGLIEFTTKPVPADEAVSPFDNIDRVRLTKLGRYASGLDDVYEPPRVEKNESFSVSPTKLIIKCTEDNPYRHVLNGMAQDIGNNRWAVTTQSFLDKCYTVEDVQNKIDLFRFYVDPHPSPVWERFFDSMIQHCKPLQREKLGNNYQLYSVKADNREMIEIITSDPIVSSLVIKAENFLLLIPVDNLNAVEKRFRQLGYIF